MKYGIPISARSRNLFSCVIATVKLKVQFIGRILHVQNVDKKARSDKKHYGMQMKIEL